MDRNGNTAPKPICKYLFLSSWTVQSAQKMSWNIVNTTYCPETDVTTQYKQMKHDSKAVISIKVSKCK